MANFSCRTSVRVELKYVNRPFHISPEVPRFNKNFPMRSVVIQAIPNSLRAQCLKYNYIFIFVHTVMVSIANDQRFQFLEP